MQHGSPPPSSRHLAQALPRQMQQGQQAALRALPGRADQARSLSLVPSSRADRNGVDSFARLRSQSPRQVDEAMRIQQQQASSSEDF